MMQTFQIMLLLAMLICSIPCLCYRQRLVQLLKEKHLLLLKDEQMLSSWDNERILFTSLRVAGRERWLRSIQICYVLRYVCVVIFSIITVISVLSRH